MATPARLIETSDGTLTAAFGPSEWALLVATAVIWGSSYLLISVALEGLRPLAVTFVRVALGLAVVSCLPTARGVVVRPSDRPRIALLGVLWLALPLTLYPIAQRHLSSSTAGMITGSQPLMAAAVAALLLRRRPTRTATVGLALGFAGVILVVSASATGASARIDGAVLILAAVACYAVATNLAVPMQQRYGAIAVIRGALLVAFALLAIPGSVGLAQSDPTLGAIAAVIPLGALSTGAGYLTFTTLVGRAGATRGAVAIYLVPVVAIGLGWMFRGEQPRAIALVGAALVSGGALLVGRSRR